MTFKDPHCYSALCYTLHIRHNYHHLPLAVSTLPLQSIHQWHDMNHDCPSRMEAMKRMRIMSFAENPSIIPILQQHHITKFTPTLQKIGWLDAKHSKTLEASHSFSLDISSCSSGVIQETTKEQNWKLHNTMHGALELKHF